MSTTLQVLPFHCSISAVEIVLPLPLSPTAKQSVADTHVTRKRTLPLEGDGEDTTVHALPSHCSVSVAYLLVLM